ncbi:MAG: hypothetical protein IKM30_03955 [Oscillospiraceae bacterium]|nr:hypothetical protein [Oscillospiraceae bacterium]
MTDQTIQTLLDADAAAEHRLHASQEEKQLALAKAKKTAAAHSEARMHRTKDQIFEIEEAERAAYEQQYQALQENYERQLAEMTELFENRRETLLDALMQQVLQQAEH